MKRRLFLGTLSCLLFGIASADPAPTTGTSPAPLPEQAKKWISFKPHFEEELFPGPITAPAQSLGDPEKAMRFAESLLKKAGPRVGERMFESCNLLCLGDLRPYASWNGFLLDHQESDDAAIDRLNHYLVPLGYSLHPKVAREDGQVPTFSLHSLAGLEFTTRRSKLNWVPKYDRRTGWKGYYAWKAQMYKNLPADEFQYHKIEGIMLGYPDSAVDHFGSLCVRFPFSIGATIPNVGFYSCGVPIYDIKLEDINLPDIVDHEKTWSQFLQKAYASKINQRLLAQPEFRQHYLGVDQRRLETSLFSYDLNTRSERWLLANQNQLASMAAKYENLETLSRLLGRASIRVSNLRDWLLRGALKDGDAASVKFFKAYQAAHPAACQAKVSDFVTSRLRSDGLLALKTADYGFSQGWYHLASSDYVADLFCHLSSSERHELYDILSQSTYPPIQSLISEAKQGRGPLAKFWAQSSGKSHP